jgi:DNA-binding NtrC family response regulator
MQENNYIIFIIDSDLNHANEIQNHLKNHNHYTFYLFKSPDECKLHMHLNPALIFLDHELTPFKNNYAEVLKELKLLAPKAEVVLFTGVESIEIIKDSMHYGAYDYYVKDHHALLKAEYLIVQILHKHQLKQEIEKQKKSIKLLLLIITALICMVIIMYFTGFINDAYIGGDMF